MCYEKNICILHTAYVFLFSEVSNGHRHSIACRDYGRELVSKPAIDFVKKEKKVGGGYLP